MLLGRMKLSASGCDAIPAWLQSKCSYELADIVAYIINCSISSRKVPSYWLNALVTPVPKINNPSTFSHFRPISVTPHISKLTEKNYRMAMALICHITRSPEEPVCIQTHREYYSCTCLSYASSY